MKSPAPWLELSIVVTGLMVWMLGVMWIQRSDGGCALSFEEPRRLVVSRETDREHLAADLASVDRVARRYARATEEPVLRQTRFLECRTTLARQVAVRHGASPEGLAATSSDSE